MRQRDKQRNMTQTQNKLIKLQRFKTVKPIHVFLLLPGDFLSEGVLPALFCPGGQAAEAGRACDIVDKEHSVDVTIVVLHHGLSETLLSCRVPQLELAVREKNNKQREMKEEMNE